MSDLPDWLAAVQEFGGLEDVVEVRWVTDDGETHVLEHSEAAPSEAGFQLRRKRDGPADEEDLRFHLDLLDRRDDLYAHNDDTPARRLFDVAEDVTDREVIVTQDHGLWESFDELTAEDFARIARLADELIDRFTREQSEIAARLRSDLSD